MGEVEILINEEGTLNAVQHYNPRSLLGRLKDLERHRALKWLNCNTCSLDFKVPNTTTYTGSPDDLFNGFLRFFFIIVLSLGVIKILFENSMIHTLPGTYYHFPIFAVTIVAAAIVKKKMRNTDLTTQRTEEVKKISGIIQEV